MSVSVIVPYRSDGGPRDANWSFLQEVWGSRFPNWEVITGDCTSHEWVKAEAVGRCPLARARERHSDG